MRLLRTVLWWLKVYALWWLLVATWSPWNAIWGAVVASLATMAAAATGGPDWGVRKVARGWAGELGSAAVQVLLDFAVLAGTLASAVVQRDQGPNGRLLLRGTDAVGPDAAARRAWVTLVATWSPNAYVIDVDSATGRTLVHDLRLWRRSEEPV